MAHFFPPYETCPICDSSKIHFDLKIHYWHEHTFSFFKCSDCHATFANPMPSDALISRGNSALVRYYQQHRSLQQEFREARQAYLRGKLLAQKLRRWKRKGTLLELGCFHGFFALGFKENSDWEVEGLEISEELCDFIRTQLGFTCHLGTLEKAELPLDRYDFIVCHDLIEHINQPKVFLKKLHAILRPQGRVQIITPNSIQDLAYSRRAAQQGISVNMLLNHIMYFSPKTLQVALESTGLVPKKLYCFDVRYAPHDFGWFGLGKPTSTPKGPLIDEALSLETHKTLSLWNPSKLDELRRDKKVSQLYGFFRETLPKMTTIHVPPGLGVGHEIYALAEKT